MKMRTMFLDFMRELVLRDEKNLRRPNYSWINSTIVQILETSQPLTILSINRIIMQAHNKYNPDRTPPHIFNTSPSSINGQLAKRGFKLRKKRNIDRLFIYNTATNAEEVL